jgi:nitroimidazol reductase NimA-like FMN-containing flavoprotein (pyridoxamine 5'-phosphate oxidase superfamily)
MTASNPTTELDARFSSEDASATPWQEGDAVVDKAEIYWLSTVRPDGRPHVTPLIAIWLDGVFYFTTGETERKAKNLVDNAQCVVTTGCNSYGEGLDVVIEGEAQRVRDETLLQRLADRYAAKYNRTFTVSNGNLSHEAGEAWVFAVSPATAFGFGRGETFSQTRWRF